MKTNSIHSRLAAVILIGAALTTTVTANDTYKFDQNGSKISFRVRQYLGGANGQFKKFSGTIDLDREHPEKSAVSAKIDVASIDTGIKKRDDHLRSEEFFNVAKYPEITFKSRGAKQNGPQSGDLTGDLTMHGVTKSVVLHVKLLTPVKADSAPKETKWEITTEPLRRKDFNLMFSKTSESVSGISQDVSIKIEVTATSP